MTSSGPNRVLASLARRRPPAGYCLIAVQDNHPHLDVYLDSRAPELTPDAGPPVVRFEAVADTPAPDRASASSASAPGANDQPEQVYPAYPSLPDMIVSTAFARFRIATLPHLAYLVPSGPTWWGQTCVLGPVPGAVEYRVSVTCNGAPSAVTDVSAAASGAPSFAVPGGTCGSTPVAATVRFRTGSTWSQTSAPGVRP